MGFDHQLDCFFVSVKFDGNFSILKIDFVAPAITAANDDMGHCSYLPSKPANPPDYINLFGGTFILRVMLVVRDDPYGWRVTIGDML